MNNRFKLSAIPKIVRPPVGQFPALQLRSMLYAQYHPLSTFSARANQVLMATGCVAFAVMVAMFFKPEFVDQLTQLSPFSMHYDTQAADRSSELSKISERRASQVMSPTLLSEQQNLQVIRDTDSNIKSDTESEQKRITTWLAKRYQIAGSGSKLLVEAAYNSALEAQIEPLLVLAVMAIESRMNPYTASAKHAKNLIPVITTIKKYDPVEQGIVKSELQPLATVQVMAHILKEYLQRGGSVEAGLKLYVGAAKMRSDRGYITRVLAEYQRLQFVSKGHSAPDYDPMLSIPENKSLHEANADPIRPGRKTSPGKPA